MPYPNYHAARVRDPGQFARIRSLQTLPNGIQILGGPLKGGGGGSTAQSYRFPKSRFTAAQARAWLKSHNIKTIGFETASGSTEETEGLFYQANIFEGATLQETDQERVIHNALILGLVSKNNRGYLPEAARRAVPLYDGAKCYLNHASEAEAKNGRRNVEGLVGRFRLPRFDEVNEQIRADLPLLKDDPAANKVWNIANQMPNLAGFSHNASGRMKRIDGRDIVEEITKVISVDLVAEPATTRGVFEHVTDERKGNSMEYEDLTLDDLKARRHDLYETIVNEGKTSRDDEVKQLTEEKEKIEGELDELKVKNATREKEAVVEKALRDLPEHAQTDVFRRQCMNVKPEEGKTFEEAVAELVKDRKTATEGTGVHNMGGDKVLDKPSKEDAEQRGPKIDEALTLD